MQPGAFVLQMCDASKDFQDYMSNFQFVEAVTCVYADAVTFAVLGLVVWTAVAGSIYIRTGSVLIPFGLLLLTGGAVLTQMAAISTAFAVVLLLIVPGGVMAYAYYRWSF